jgi:hypothetical protein
LIFSEDGEEKPLTQLLCPEVKEFIPTVNTPATAGVRDNRLCRKKRQDLP